MESILILAGVVVCGYVLYLKALKPWMLKKAQKDSDTDYSAGQ